MRRSYRSGIMSVTVKIGDREIFEMNRLLSKIGAAVVTASVFLFAICLIVDHSFGSYFVCMFLPIGYIMMAAGFHYESKEEDKVASNIGMVLSGVYAVFVLLVYFAQTTSVRLEELSDQAAQILDFKRGGLIFNYDLLGYGMMALSTLFMGLTVHGPSQKDKWLKALMIIHGVFFIGCFLMPMTGVFSSMSDGKTSRGGVVALVFWCIYFLPIGILSFLHFHTRKT